MNLLFERVKIGMSEGEVRNIFKEHSFRDCTKRYVFLFYIKDQYIYVFKFKYEGDIACLIHKEIKKNF
jgi:hypothetical protein